MVAFSRKKCNESPFVGRRVTISFYFVRLAEEDFPFFGVFTYVYAMRLC